MEKRLVKKICRSGDCVEEFYCLKGLKKMTRAERKKGASDLRKADSNFKTAVKRLARTLNCNFHSGDMLITLDYEDGSLKDEGGIERDGRLFLRRLKYRLKKQGQELKSVWVIGQRSSQTLLPARPHHHIVMNRVDFETVCANWPMGNVNYRLLQNQKDYTSLAVYLLRNVKRDIPDAKKYRPSRNLKLPEWDEVTVRKMTPIKTPKNAKVMSREEYDPARGRDYVRYTV